MIRKVDYVILASSGIIVASVIILASFLSRYNRLVKESAESSRLAKDVWDSMNTRFSVVDSRIIDLMARTEVISARLGVSFPTSNQVHSAAASGFSSSAAAPAFQAASIVPVGIADETETEVKVLRLLAAGPKTSAQIKDEVGRSREHTARLMKALFERGLVVRNDRNKPYVYEITSAGRSHAAS